MTVSSHLPPTRGDHGMRRQIVVESLLREIVQGDLRPGQHLVTQTLASRFGMSHTPIREALIALAGIGLVELVPNRGTVVRQVTTRDVREVCQVRRALECEAVRTACGRIDPAELASLKADLQALLAPDPALHPRLVEVARAVDSRLHDRIAASAGNAFLAQELGRLTLLFRAFRDASWRFEESRNDYRRIEVEAREHLAIVEALIAHDRPAAVRAMARHIRSGVATWSRALPKAPRTTPDA